MELLYSLRTNIVMAPEFEMKFIKIYETEEFRWNICKNPKDIKIRLCSYYFFYMNCLPKFFVYWRIKPKWTQGCGIDEFERIYKKKSYRLNVCLLLMILLRRKSLRTTLVHCSYNIQYDNPCKSLRNHRGGNCQRVINTFESNVEARSICRL